MAIDIEPRKEAQQAGVSPAIVIALVLALAAAAAWFLFPPSVPAQDEPLTAEAKGYLGNLPLEDIGMTIAEAFGGGKLLEIKGKIGNTGNRAVKRAEVYCVFRDALGQIVLRQRWPIVSTGLKPNEAKPFRLPFDTVPDSWNQQLPNVVVASITFE